MVYWDNPLTRRWLTSSTHLSSLLRILCNLFVIVHSSLSLLDRLVILVARLRLADQAFIHLPGGRSHGVGHRSAVVGETAGETSWFYSFGLNWQQMSSFCRWKTVKKRQALPYGSGSEKFGTIHRIPKKDADPMTFCRRSVRIESSFWIFALSSSSCRLQWEWFGLLPIERDWRENQRTQLGSFWNVTDKLGQLL